jgi:hypothetical protein
VYGQQPAQQYGQAPQSLFAQPTQAVQQGSAQPGQQQFGQPGYGQQYGQQPQYGQQQYGQAPYGRPEPGRQAWPGQPQWGQSYPTPPGPAAGGKRKPPMPLIIGGAAGVVVIAVVGVLGFVTPGFFVTRVFDSAAVEQGVARVLTQDFGISGVGEVSCGEAIPVKADSSFDCDATIDGQKVRVPVHVTSNEGNYEVGRPV